jgi:hypothetical protein
MRLVARMQTQNLYAYFPLKDMNSLFKFFHAYIIPSILVIRWLLESRKKPQYIYLYSHYSSCQLRGGSSTSNPNKYHIIIIYYYYYMNLMEYIMGVN